MTLKQFLEENYFELFGIVADSMDKKRQGSETAMWLEIARERLRKRIRLMYESLVPSEDVLKGPHTNGVRKQDGKVGV